LSSARGHANNFGGGAGTTDSWRLTASNSHTSLAPLPAGIGLFELSRLMGTSVEQIDRTYGHLLPDSLDRARTALDMFSLNETAKEEAR
jgi:hypothetical protein